MPNVCLEERLANALMLNKFYRWLFVAYTGSFDLKNRIIKREFRRWVKSHPIEKPRVLDVGFGFGQQIHYLLDVCPKANVLGLDISDKAVASVNKYFFPAKYPNVYCKKKDIIDFNGNAAFDLVLAFKLLNYIENDATAIQKMHEALKPGGTLLIINSHANRKLERKEFDDVHSLPLFRNGYAMQEIRDMLKDAGFTKIKYRYIYGPTGLLAWKIAIGFPLRLMKKSNSWLLFLIFYYIVAAPLILALNYYDMHVGHTSGQSIFIKAEK